MDMKTLQIFIHLADSLHFGQTAKHCNLSPSAISRQLQRLEDAVGHQLFERNNRQARLTPAGRHFQDYAHKAVDDWQRVLGDLNTNHSDLHGEVSLFGSVTASYSMLTQILSQMRETCPGIELKLRTGDQADGVERILAGQDDSAIVATPKVLPDKLAFLSLRTTPLQLIGPKTRSALSLQIDRAIADNIEPNWAEIPMVLAERGLAREQLLTRLKEMGQKPNIYAQVAGHEAVVSMVSLGFGVAVVPKLVIEHSPKRDTVRVLPWLTNLQPFTLSLCALKARIKDPLLKALWDCAQQTHPQNV
ncbi:MAG: LysR family positive regulator for ilvC [Polaribacter sp.]|jgi:LysR family positive regulator for ilvC